MTVAQNATDGNRRRGKGIPGQNGQTQDVGVIGVYLETDESYAPGSEVDFLVDIESLEPGGIVRLICKGRFVRVERRDDKLRVAVTIDSHRFQAIKNAK